MKTIKLAPGLSLPADEAATQRYALVGLPGMGKSNAAGVLVEALLDHKEQVIVLDPASIWWSLRLQADGKTPAYDIVVMGGDHGDIPLTPASGKLVAETLAGSSTSAVLDVSDFTIGEQRKFVTDFAEAFFHAKKRHRSPVMVVLEEAHEFIPERGGSDEARMFGALKRANKIGRNYGIGWCYMDHRPQELNKAVLNLVANLFVFGMSGGLPIGSAQVWSPRWLKVDGQFKFPLKRTYDAGKTPVRGQQAVALKPIDVARLQTAMGAIEQERQASDPKALKAEIARLQRALKEAPQAAPKVVERVVEKPVAPKGLSSLIGKAEELADLVRKVRLELEAQPAKAPPVQRPESADKGHRLPRSRPEAAPQPAQWPEDSGRMNGGWPSEFVGKMKDIVIALASWQETMDKAQLALMVGMTVGGGGFNNYLGKLRAGGWVTTDRGGLALTLEGRTLAPEVHTAQTPDEILELWGPRLVGKMRDMVDVLRHHPDGVSKEDLAGRVNMEASAGGFKRTSDGQVSFCTTLDVGKFPATGWGQLLAHVIADLAALLPGLDEGNRRDILAALAGRLATIIPRHKDVS